MNNLKYPFSLPGFLKAITVMLGLFCSAIAGHAYDRSFYNNLYKIVAEMVKIFPPEIKTQLEKLMGESESMGKEGYFLSIVVIFTVMSLTFYICHLMAEELGNNPGNQFVDAGFHGLGALLIFIGACLVISSAVNINKEENSSGKDLLKQFGASSLLQKASDVDTLKFQYKSEKIAAGVLGLINSIIYGLTAWVVFIGKPQPAT